MKRLIPLLVLAPALLLCGCHDDRSYTEEDHPGKEVQVDYILRGCSGQIIAASAERRINDRMSHGWDLWRVVSRGEGGLYLVFTRRPSTEAVDNITRTDDE